jgi:hypothetical protein
MAVPLVTRQVSSVVAGLLLGLAMRPLSPGELFFVPTPVFSGPCFRLALGSLSVELPRHFEAVRPWRRV